MDQLPDLVAAAIKAGLASTKTLSWKVQEGEKALLEMEACHISDHWRLLELESAL